MAEIHVRLAGGYPWQQVDRLARQLEPLIALQEPTRVVLDMSSLVNVGPTALALLTAVVVRLRTENLLDNFSAATFPRSPLTRNYLSRMDVFKHFFGDQGPPEPFERHEAIGFRPCRQFTGADDYTTVAREMTEALVERCNTDRIAEVSIRIALDELTENVVHHADSPVGGFAAAQAWRRRDALEIGIVDLGIGIQASLTKNPAHADLQDDVSAIQAALEPHVSSTPERNSGIGLFVTRALLATNGGTLAVRSGTGAVYTGESERTFVRELDFPGTMVTLRARTDRPLNINEVYRQLPDDEDADAADDRD